MLKRWVGIFLLWPILACANPQIIDKIIFFGDSLTDTGNLYKALGHILPKSPPYFKGHFSDGTIWAEKLYQSYFPGRDDMAKYNYAVGGASAVYSIHSPIPYTLSNEVTDYIYLHDDKDKSQVLYVVWIGGNNYLYAPKDTDAITTKVVNGIEKQVKRLIARGGHLFMLLNLPDMSTTPYGREHHTTEQMAKLSVLHNKKLAAKVEAMQAEYPDVTFVYFNMNRFFADMYEHPGKYHVNELKRPCFPGGYVFQPGGYNEQNRQYLQQLITENKLSMSTEQQEAILANPVLSEALMVGASSRYVNLSELHCEHFLFFDHIHPTHAMHEYLAKYAMGRLHESGIYSKDQLKTS